MKLPVRGGSFQPGTEGAVDIIHKNMAVILFRDEFLSEMVYIGHIFGIWLPPRKLLPMDPLYYFG